MLQVIVVGEVRAGEVQILFTPNTTLVMSLDTVPNLTPVKVTVTDAATAPTLGVTKVTRDGA
jgi:hypothetical protein